jgi:hypothetical protein
MLDRHEAIGGIGEFDGLDHICRAMTSHPMWLRVPVLVPQPLVDDLRRRYLEGAAQIRRAGATWTLDKSLRAWRALPEIATIFPVPSRSLSIAIRAMSRRAFFSVLQSIDLRMDQQFRCDSSGDRSATPRGARSARCAATSE